MKPKEVSEKLRVVVEQHKDEYTQTFGLRISDMATDAADAIDSLQVFVDLINSLPNCNDCGLKSCTSRPGLGETIRYNCPGYTKCEQPISGMTIDEDLPTSKSDLEKLLKQRVSLIFCVPKSLLE